MTKKVYFYHSDNLRSYPLSLPTSHPDRRFSRCYTFAFLRKKNAWLQVYTTPRILMLTWGECSVSFSFNIQSDSILVWDFHQIWNLLSRIQRFCTCLFPLLWNKLLAMTFYDSSGQKLRKSKRTVGHRSDKKLFCVLWRFVAFTKIFAPKSTLAT